VLRDLLDALSEDERRLVLSTMTRKSFRKGDTLFHDGDPGDTMHLVVKGRVAVRVSTPTGDVVTLAVLGPGSAFGEQALLTDDNRRTASVVALDPVETRVLHRREFDDLRQRHPATERLLVTALSAQTRRLTSQLVEALFEPVETRVLRRLRELAALYDTGAETVTIDVRQEDLASMAGTTRPTANRVLKQLEDERAVSLGRGKIVIHDRAAVERRAR
jgi:CRP/FNR family transcriptional regulator, cyclic AMP receptor protein